MAEDKKSSPWKEEHSTPFELTDIEDVRILVKANGKHYSLVAKEGVDPHEAKACRIFLLDSMFQWHAIIDTALEDIQKQKS